MVSLSTERNVASTLIAFLPQSLAVIEY